MNIITIKKLHKSFEGADVVKGIDLEIREGEFLTLLGPSGCGKTTTLRMIAGFEDADSGSICIDGKEVSDLPPFKRKVNTVFQNYALFPLMNVFDNVAYGLTVKRLGKAEIRDKVGAALRTVQLDGFEKRRVGQLSGGQKQRVAIARAIVNDPKVLLLDEPLGALDFKLRKQMQLELKRLQKRLGITFVYVTHDQEEAMTMSDRIAVMHAGVIEQIDVPERIYHKPQTRFVADFIGESDILEAEACAETPLSECGDKNVRTRAYKTAFGTVTAPDCGHEAGTRLYLCIRPEAIRTSHQPVPGFEGSFKVTENICTGNLIKTAAVSEEGTELKISRLAGTETFSKDEILYPYWDAADCAVAEH